jgi:hypothetical protein
VPDPRGVNLIPAGWRKGSSGWRRAWRWRAYGHPPPPIAERSRSTMTRARLAAPFYVSLEIAVDDGAAGRCGASRPIVRAWRCFRRPRAARQWLARPMGRAAERRIGPIVGGSEPSGAIRKSATGGFRQDPTLWSIFAKGPLRSPHEVSPRAASYPGCAGQIDAKTVG